MSLLTRLVRQPLVRFGASLENPATPFNGQTVRDHFLGGGEAASGVYVSSESALTYSPWWKGVNLIANTVAKLPINVFTIDADERKVKDKTHPAYKVLRRPNERQTRFDFRRQLMGHAIARGNGYALIYRDGAGVPQSLVPVDPSNMTPVRENDRLWYVLRVTSTETRKLRPDEVLHVKGFSYDGLVAYSVVDKARETLGLAIGERQWATVFFKNAARPSVVLQFPGTLSPEASDRLRNSWERMQAGLDNAHRTAVLDRGATANAISFSAEDAKLIESMQMSIIDAANFLMLAPHKLGSTMRQGYNTLEQENQSSLDDAIDPWLVNWEQECDEKLLTDEELQNESACIEFDRKAMLRADRAAMANYNRTALAGQPWKVVNEVREEDGLDPLDDPKANELQSPLNMGQGGPQNEPAKPGGPPPGRQPGDKPANDGGDGQAAAKAAHKALLTEVVGRAVRRIASQAERAAKGGVQLFMSWLTDHAAVESKVIREMLVNVEAVIAAGQADKKPLSGEAADWLMVSMQAGWSAVADEATPKNLLTAVEAEKVRQEQQLAADACSIFVE